MNNKYFIETVWYKSIAFKVTISIILLVTFTVVLLSFFIMNEEKKHTESELIKIGLFLSETLARQAAVPILYEDRPALQNLIGVYSSLSPLPSVENIVAYVLIYNKDGKFLASAGKPREIQEIGELPSNPEIPDRYVIRRIDREHFEISVPIMHQKNKTGLLRVGITEKFRFELVEAVENKTLLATGILMAVGVLVSLYMARKFIKPLLVLADFARRIGEGKWGEKVDINTSDEVGGLAQSFNDMSLKLKNAFEEIKKTQNQLIQSEKFSALGKLSANLAHELKNPLTSIKMIMESAIEKEGQVDCTPQDLEIMIYETNRMESLVNEILSFAGPKKLNLHVNDINEVIHSIYSQLRYKLEIAGIQSHIEVDKSIPLFAFDSKRMEQALFNIILNAVEVMPEGGDLTIMTHWSPSTQEVLVQVIDTGPGIPASIRNQIFDPFFTTKESGTGLGLSIVYTIIRDHGGIIEVESPEQGGSTFWITLPILEKQHVSHFDR